MTRPHGEQSLRWLQRGRANENIWSVHVSYVPSRSVSINYANTEGQILQSLSPGVVWKDDARGSPMRGKDAASQLTIDWFWLEEQCSVAVKQEKYPVWSFQGLGSSHRGSYKFPVVKIFVHSLTNPVILGLFVGQFCVVESGILFAMFHFPRVWPDSTRGVWEPPLWVAMTWWGGLILVCRCIICLWLWPLIFGTMLGFLLTCPGWE